MLVDVKKKKYDAKSIATGLQLFRCTGKGCATRGNEGGRHNVTVSINAVTGKGTSKYCGTYRIPCE